MGKNHSVVISRMFIISLFDETRWNLKFSHNIKTFLPGFSCVCAKEETCTNNLGTYILNIRYKNKPVSILRTIPQNTALYSNINCNILTFILIKSVLAFHLSLYKIKICLSIFTFYTWLKFVSFFNFYWFFEDFTSCIPSHSFPVPPHLPSTLASSPQQSKFFNKYQQRKQTNQNKLNKKLKGEESLHGICNKVQCAIQLTLYSFIITCKCSLP